MLRTQAARNNGIGSHQQAYQPRPARVRYCELQFTNVQLAQQQQREHSSALGCTNLPLSRLMKEW